jgi:phosphopantetheinyl transferase (holo-ACP synthase)
MPTIKIHNVSTDEIIEREMNADELAQWEADKASAEAEAAELTAKEAARQALLDKLGITADEAKLLLG